MARQTCQVAGEAGTCMFVWECLKTEGKHLGMCMDGFMFGSCCVHNDDQNKVNWFWSFLKKYFRPDLGMSLDSKSADKELKAVTPEKSKSYGTAFTKKLVITFQLLRIRCGHISLK